MTTICLINIKGINRNNRPKYYNLDSIIPSADSEEIPNHSQEIVQKLMNLEFLITLINKNWIIT